ncbi:MAG TPA: DUF6602 domain-containing protein [Gemmatimonadaceae bacterium]|jgi:hypothetical protein
MIDVMRESRPKNTAARDWFCHQQEKMVAELREVRAVHDHPTAKGDGTELHWMKLLQNRLPNRYRAERAFVVDADGNRSDQIDIVIHDRQFCPILLDTAGGLQIPAESVYAVLEVKQELSKSHIEYAGEKIQSVRRLHRTSAEFCHASGRSRTTPKDILGGIVTFNSGWSPAFGDAFETALRGLPVEHRIDLGCALCDGGFEIVYDRGESRLTQSAADSSLIFFLLRLLHRLQQIATVAAIDYVEYSRLLVMGEDEAANAGT